MKVFGASAVVSQDQARVRTQEPRVSRRPVRIGHDLIAGTTSGAADTVYTVRDGVLFEVKRLTVVNTSGSAVTLDLHTVPSAGSIADGNTEINALSIAANTAVDLTDMIGGLYDAGTTFQAWAGTTNVLVVHGWGEEIL